MSELTSREQETLETYLKVGTKQGVADLIGISRSAVRSAIERIERKGKAPWLAPGPIPEHMNLHKVTVQRNAEGQVVQDWVRLVPQVQAMQDFVDGLCEKVKGKGKVTPRKPRKTDGEEMLFEVDLYDIHAGMLALKEETRDSNYDTNIATKRMVDSVEALAQYARRPKKCVLVFGGDALHASDRKNMTPQSNHILDVDTRYHKVVSHLIAASRECVQICASFAETVEIVVLEGNHSPIPELFLAQVLQAYYHECPNIKVHLEASPRRSMVWGDNLLVWAHGDKIAPAKWALVVAAEFAKEWGQTKYRYLRLGHQHHQKVVAPVQVDEQAGLVVEYLPALCSSDAWAANAGFVGAQKGATGFEYSKTRGCIARYFNQVA